MNVKKKNTKPDVKYEYYYYITIILLLSEIHIQIFYMSDKLWISRPNTRYTALYCELIHVTSDRLTLNPS